MTQERLSKLQKWILENSYHVEGGRVTTAIRKVDVFRYFKPTYTIGNQELPIRNNFKAFMSHKEYNVVNATISRSLRSLKSRGYVKLIGHKKEAVPNFEAIKEDMGNYETKEEYMAGMKSKDPTEIMKGYDKWFRKVDLVVEIDGRSPHKTKIVQLTPKGVEKAGELLKLSSPE